MIFHFINVYLMVPVQQYYPVLFCYAVNDSVLYFYLCYNSVVLVMFEFQLFLIVYVSTVMSVTGSETCCIIPYW